MLDFIKTGSILDSELKIVLKEVDQFKHKAGTASIYSEKTGPSIDKNVRSGKIYFTQPLESKNIFHILQSHIIEKYLKFPFNFTNVSSVQYAYYGIEDHFKWHQDVIKINGQDLFRTFTMSMNISPADSYSGGELLLKYKDQVIELDRKPGSYIIFPSFLVHQASKVLSGIRESIVVWVQSPKEELNYLENLFRQHHS